MRNPAPFIKDILKDPSATYKSPQDVMDDADLTHEQKSEILRCWEEDETAKQRAESENMNAPEDQQMTGETLALISTLRAKLKQDSDS